MEGPAHPGNFPLFDWFPALSGIPRVPLCTLPSPVAHLGVIRDDLWIKRDDLNAPTCGGNKVRALEFLLGGLKKGDTVFTVGGAGSTHVLSTAVHAGRIGVSTVAFRWRHAMNPVAETISDRIGIAIPDSGRLRHPVAAIAVSRYRSFTGRGRYIPVGGSSPIGMLGHVNAALELVGQIRRGEMPAPSRIVLPAGSGGTIAGLLVGLAIAGLRTEIVGARVGPRAFVNKRHIFALAGATARFIERKTAAFIPFLDRSQLRIVHDVYGGAYGRPLARAESAAKLLHDATGITLDDTYTAKAWTAALGEAPDLGGPILFWLTFDASCLTT